jgi:DNA replication protein DnaC
VSGRDCPHGRCDGSGFVLDEATGRLSDCSCRPIRISAARANHLSAVIPKRFQGVSFDRAPVVDMDPAVVREVRRYADRVGEKLDAGRGLWFMGDVGTGKTTLAMLVSKAALDAGRSVAIYSLPRLLAEIRKTYDDGADRSYLGLLDRLAAVDLLHIDDVGAERTSEWVLEQLYSIINTRYEDERAIVVTTNLDHEQLREQIGERTVSRLVEICGDPLPLYGSDRRMDVSA